jgi:hypothetical protein
LGSIYAPLTLNAYGYCVNDPLQWVDPSGRSWISDVFKWLDDLTNQVRQPFPGSRFLGGVAFYCSAGNVIWNDLQQGGPLPTPNPLASVGMLAGGTVGAGMALVALAGATAAGPALLAVGGVFLGGYLIARGAAGLIDYFWWDYGGQRPSRVRDHLASNGCFYFYLLWCIECFVINCIFSKQVICLQDTLVYHQKKV